MYFHKYCHYSGIHVWETGLCISRTRKESNKWWNGGKVSKLDNKTTGRCGLEGLRKALKYLCEFSDQLKENEELHVGWADNKRKYAYRYLFKYGFLVDEESETYHKRNSKYWNPNEYAVSELTREAYNKVF